MNRAYNSAFEILRGEYAHAIEALGSEHPTQRAGRRDRDEALADHLMTLYWHGYLQLDDELLEHFFEKAPLELRGHAIEFLGISLENAPALSEETKTRLSALWEQRLAALTTGETQAPELKGYAWWFGAGGFDDDWSLTQLRVLLTAGGHVDPDHVVAERLATLATDHLDEVVACLGLLIDATEQRWFVLGSRDEIKSILARGLGAQGAASKMSEQIVNRLASRGHVQFAELLGRTRQD